ncbi:MAG: 2,3-bisphosphoglycerate-independent phosphoglycerate mutase [Patescibacteria group bacterium]
MSKTHKTNLPAVLIILDGWGVRAEGQGNAIKQAITPNMDRLWQSNPHSLLAASGKAVGLPAKQAGNSEAGHLNIGAGRIVDQDSVKITESINNGTFYKNPAFIRAVRHVMKHKSRLHLLGMLSGDQSPHMDPKHILALIELCRQRQLDEVVLHLFTDGRDSPPHFTIKFMKKLAKILDPHREKVATIAGRLYMDRKKKWTRTEKIYDYLTRADAGFNRAASPAEAILSAYKRGETDEFISPTIIYQGGKPTPRISDNDSIIFFNLRSDRARQLSKPFVQSDFNKKNHNAFRRKKILKNIVFVAMTDFGPDLGDILTAYPSEDITGTLPMALKNYRQLYIAESDKFAHVTYFLNGGYNHPVAGEQRLLVESPDVKKYDQTPEMSAGLITDTVTSALKAQRFDFITLNYANPDMVGHTGNYKATVQAITYLDKCIGRIEKVIVKKKGLLTICADHGNADQMMEDGNKELITQHSDSPIPFIIAARSVRRKRMKAKGVLGNIAPTMLEAIGVPVPKEMTGGSLWL